VFRAGSFHITFNLKRREKVFATAGTSIHVTPGLGERDQ
jgi:REP element-mobilizing transposase RayT